MGRAVSPSAVGVALCELGLVLQLDSCRDRSVEGVVRGRAHRVHTITRHLDDVTVVLSNRVPQDRVVTSRRIAHRLGMLLPQKRRTLQVGEQEGHRPRGQLDNPGPPSRG
jgi:hypothetical protein